MYKPKAVQLQIATEDVANKSYFCLQKLRPRRGRRQVPQKIRQHSSLLHGAGARKKEQSLIKPD